MIKQTTLSLKQLFPLLKNPNFLKLWGAQMLGQTGMNALHFTLAIQVFKQTNNNFGVGILIAVLSLPAIIVQPIAGVLTDSFDRRNLLTIVNLIRMVLTLTILMAFKLPVWLIVLAFFITMASQFFVPVEQSTIPDVVSKKRLTEANSFFTFSLYGSFLIGFTGAGPLIEYGGIFITLLVIGICFALAAILNYSLPNLEKHLKYKNHSVRQRLNIKKIFNDMVAGLKYVGKQKVLLAIIIQVSFIFAVERAAIALVPAMAEQIFNFSIAEISFYMITPLAIGTVSGVLLVNKLKLKHPLIRLISIGLAIDAVVLFLLPLYGSFSHELLGFLDPGLNKFFSRLYVVLLAFLSGAADVMIIVSAQTFIQKNVNAQIRGRVFASLLSTMNLVGVPLVLIISLMADLINILYTLVSFGLATLIMTIWGSRYFKQHSAISSKY